jgi:ArsR family transcriptional regulator, arsenate/arsenite/antimonite-responsive transcriptional repressor
MFRAMPTALPLAHEIRAARVAALAKALADPVRAGLLEAVHRSGGEVCQCELQPLFEVSQPTLSHHLRKLTDAGLLTVERRGRWAYYRTDPDALEVLRSWLS